MYKKSIFTLLLFLAPIGIIEKYKKDRSIRIINYEYNMVEENNLTIKDCLEGEDLLSQKRYCSSSKKFFHNFVRNEYKK